MTELLKAAIASGQVSAAQIAAHQAAGELPITMFEPPIAQPVPPAFDVNASVRYILRVVRSKSSLSDIDDCRIRDVIRAELLAAIKATS